MKNIYDSLEFSKKKGHIEFFIEERDETHVISRMPIQEGILNPFGVVQAGALVWLADVTASNLVLGNRKLGKNGKGFPLAIDLHTTLVGNLRQGEITAKAQYVHKGRKVSVVRTRITGNGKLLAELTSTHVLAE